MKKWSEIFFKWKTMNVPDVGFIPYQAELHDEYQPWYEIKTKQQVKFKATPIYDTAKHLAILRNKDDELLIAFKLLAFIKENRSQPIYDDLTTLVVKVIAKYGYTYWSWWHPNAKHMYPELFDYRHNGVLSPYKRSAIEDTELFIEQAALMWKSIAEYYALVKIPCFNGLDKV